MNKSLLIFFSFFLIVTLGYGFPGKTVHNKLKTHKKAVDADSTNSVTVSAVTEIKYQAESAIKTLESVLNSITFNDNTPSELAGYIKNSFTPDQRSRVFVDNTIIVESDIDPKFILGKNKDLPVEKYLNDLDLSYEKTGDFSIKFSNITSSNVKKTDHIYIRVRYDESFGSKYKPDGSTYPMRQREATIKMIPVGKKKWNAFIESIAYFNPDLPIESKDHDMQIISSDAPGNENTTATEAEMKKALDAKKTEVDEIEKQTKLQIKEFEVAGDNYRNLKQYDDALASYNNAMTLAKVDPKLFKKIRDTKRLQEQSTFEYWKIKGDKARNERDFVSAVKNYKTAIQLKNSESAHYQPVIDTLNRIVQIISRPDNLLGSGDYDGALAECDKVLKKEDKKKKSEFPELYLIKGMAFQKKAESKADESYLNKARENYDIAIDLFSNFKRALLVRENFYEMIKPNYGLAINDYDALTTNELDDAPDKPFFFAYKAKLKDRQHNNTWPKASINDYNTAITLCKINARTNDTTLKQKDAKLYFDKGELEYRADFNVEAGISLDSAIIINSKFTKAYFFRGLNFVKLNNTYSAGIDFAKAEQLGLEPEQLITIDSISNEYFKKGREISDKHDFANFPLADTAFDNALKIRKCNSNAFHAKAEMRLVTADQFLAKKDTASGLSKYRESIDLNNQALSCTKNLSDADYKVGLAHAQLKEYEAAVTSFNNAIKSNPKNIQAIVERGNTYLILKKFSKANDDFTAAAKLLGDKFEISRKDSKVSPKVLSNLTDSLSIAFQLKGKALYLSNDYANAIIALDNSILQEANNEAYYYKALVYYDQPQQDLSKAKEYLDHAIAIKQDYRYSYANGKTNYKRKDYQSAINHFSDAIRLDTLNNLRNTYYLRGLSYYKTGKDFPNALADFDKYASFSYAKKDTGFYAYYGITQLNSNQDSLALKSFEYALSKAKNHPLALFGLGCYYAKSGTENYLKANVSFQSAFQTHQLTKDDIKLMEETFLQDFFKDKVQKSLYNNSKKTGLNTN